MNEPGYWTWTDSRDRRVGGHHVTRQLAIMDARRSTSFEGEAVTPVIQEFRVDLDSGQRGDCVRAVIASLLDLPLTDVPHFVQIDADGGPNWWEHITGWLHTRGLALYAIDPADPRREPWAGEYYWASGPSPRGYFGPGVATCLHAVVYRDEHLAHDPHPDGGGVVGVFERWAIRPLPGRDA